MSFTSEVFLCRYAIGGYDGDRIVSSVEVFDPRVGSWMMEEPLNDTREYAGVVTIGDSIYVIGGRNENRKTLDTVCECIPIGLFFKILFIEMDFFSILLPLYIFFDMMTGGTLQGGSWMAVDKS